MSRVRGTRGDLWEQYKLAQMKYRHMSDLYDAEHVKARAWENKYWQLELEMDVIEDRLDDFANWAMAPDPVAESAESGLPEAVEAEEDTDDHAG